MGSTGESKSKYVWADLTEDGSDSEPENQLEFPKDNKGVVGAEPKSIYDEFAAQGQDMTKAEIDNVVLSSKMYGSFAVLNLVIKMLDSCPNSPKRDQLRKKVKKSFPCKFSSRVVCEFHEMDMKLNNCLTIAPANYVTKIDVPSKEYAEQVFANYNFLKLSAITFWLNYKYAEPALFKKLLSYFDSQGYNIRELTVDKSNPTTLYFDKEFPHRVGILCFYQNANDEAFYKKQSADTTDQL